VQALGGVHIRLWSEYQLEEARKYKADHYWGKGGRGKQKNTKKIVSRDVQVLATPMRP